MNVFKGGFFHGTKKPNETAIDELCKVDWAAIREEEKEYMGRINDNVKKILDRLTIPDRSVIIRNRFTGEPVECDPTAAALYACLLTLEQLLWVPVTYTEKMKEKYGSLEEINKNFYEIRLWFRVNRVEIYNILID